MKYLKSVLYTILCVGILVFVSTFIPAVYEPATPTSETIANKIHTSYQDIAKQLGVDEKTLTAIVTPKDIEHDTSSLDIQKRGAEALEKVSKAGAYHLDESMITSISAKLQGIYEAYVIQTDMSDTFQQIRTYSLITAIIAEAGLLMIGFIQRKKTDSK